MSSQRSRALTNPIDESTLGQGDCAFNAFALSFCTPRVLNHLEQKFQSYQQPNRLWRRFIDRVAPLLAVEAEWTAVKTKLLALRYRGSVTRLQRILAPVFRELAIELMRHDAESLELTIEPMTTAFRNHVHHAVGLQEPTAQDDVYEQHAFIKRRFKHLARVTKFLLQVEPAGFNFKRYIELLLQDGQMSLEQRHELGKLVSQLDPFLISRHDKYSPVFAIYFSAYPEKFELARYRELQVKKNRSADENTELKQLEEQLDLLFAAVQKILLRWWRRPKSGGGYQRFMDEMKLPTKWAGDMELAKLAAYFNLNLDVYLDDSHLPQRLHFDSGTISYAQLGHELTKNDVEQLILRGIVNRTPYLSRALQSVKEFDKAKTKLTFAFLPLADATLQARLADVPDIEKVRALIENNRANLKGVVVLTDHGLSAPCVAALLQRDVLIKVGGSGNYKFNLDADAAVERIAALPQHELLAACIERRYRDNAVVALRHRGLHWNSVLTQEEHQHFLNSQDAIYTSTDLYRETLSAMQQNKIQYNHKRWQEIIERATDHPAATDKIRYAVDGKEDSDIELSDDTDEELRMSVEKARQERLIVYVDSADAEALDAELAKKMQLELYEEYQQCPKI